MASLMVGKFSFTLTDPELEYWFESNGYPIEAAYERTDLNRRNFGARTLVVPQDNNQPWDASDQSA